MKNQILRYLANGSVKGVLLEDKTESLDESVLSVSEESHLQAGAIWDLIGHVEGDGLKIPMGEGYLNGFLWKKDTTYVNFHKGIIPVLRPIDILFKDNPTVRNNGKNIDVQGDVEQIVRFNEDEDPAYPTEKISCQDYLLGFKDRIHELPSSVVEYLLSLNFDLFGMIESKKAISTNAFDEHVY